MRRGPLALLLAIGLAVLPAAFCGAAGQAIGLPGQKRDLPIEINADQGVEWQQEKQVYIAHGHASARQGDVTIYADTLTARYHKGATGSTQFWRIDADGHVRIVAPQQTAYGTKAVYDVINGILVLTGSPRLVTQTDQITARDSLEFWEQKSMAVARGDAIIVRDDKRLRADVLTGLFAKGKDGKSHLDRVEAFNNVVLSSPTEIVRGQRGVYDVNTGIAVLRGSVKITRGTDQLNGAIAEVNMNTGVSRMLSGDSGRVRGYFRPRGAAPQQPKAPQPDGHAPSR
jgi:lipopolysaccharide export system protein LptA